MYLDKDSILKADDLGYEDLFVPEWGGSVRLRTLSGAERDAFESSVQVDKKGKEKINLSNLRARLCSLVMVNDKGDRLFGDSDVLALGRKSAAALDRVFLKAQEMNGLSDQDVEEMTADFTASPSEPSDSDLPHTSI